MTGKSTNTAAVIGATGKTPKSVHTPDESDVTKEHLQWTAEDCNTGL